MEYCGNRQFSDCNYWLPVLEWEETALSVWFSSVSGSYCHKTPQSWRKNNCSHNLELYLCLQQQQQQKSEVKVWKNMEVKLFSLFGWEFLEFKQTPLKIVNGLNPNVENTRPEVLVWKKYMRWDWSTAGLFLNSTCAVNLLHCLSTVWNLGSLCWWATGVTGSDLKEESQWQTFTISAKMVALLSLSKIQKARKPSLQFGIEISCIMDKILEMKMQWNLMDIPVPGQCQVRTVCI